MKILCAVIFIEQLFSVSEFFVGCLRRIICALTAQKSHDSPLRYSLAVGVAVTFGIDHGFDEVFSKLEFGQIFQRS